MKHRVTGQLVALLSLLCCGRAFALPPKVLRQEFAWDDSKSSLKYVIVGENLETVTGVWLDAVKLTLLPTIPDVDVEGDDLVQALVPSTLKKGRLKITTPGGTYLAPASVDIPRRCLSATLAVQNSGGKLVATLTVRNATSSPCTYDSAQFIPGTIVDQSFRITYGTPPLQAAFMGTAVEAVEMHETPMELAVGESFQHVLNLSQNFALPKVGTDIRVQFVNKSGLPLISNAVMTKTP